jgi:hypothetical protein
MARERLTGEIRAASGIDAIRKLEHTQSSEELRTELAKHLAKLESQGKVSPELAARIKATDSSGESGRSGTGLNRKPQATPPSKLESPSTKGKADEQLFRDGVALAEKQSGSGIDNYNRVLGGLAQVNRSCGRSVIISPICRRLAALRVDS